MKLFIILIIITFATYSYGQEVGIKDINVDMDSAAVLEKINKHDNVKCLPGNSSCSEKAWIRGSVEILYLFGENTQKLNLISIKFKTHLYQTMFDSLVEKYGAPDIQKTEQLQNRAGAIFYSKTATWEIDKNMIKISERSRNIDDGSIIMSGETILLERKLKKEMTKKEPGF